jgi:RimJ/RimL family protein N-acetyltransferase
MKRAALDDRAEIEAALLPHAEFAMFPLNNLARHGMAGGHPYAVTLWVARNGGGICDVLTQTDAGLVMPYLPSGDYAAAAEVLRGREVSGLVGVRGWVRGLEAVLGLQGMRSLDHDEPHFLLDRVDLVVPDGPGRILPLSDAPAGTIKAWMLDYQLATLHTPADQAGKRVADSYAFYTTTRSHVVLMDGDTPLAMTGFNAQVPDMVQIGGVYTPPDLRGRGHARRALALHLAASGAPRATLFSASDMAARAYRAIGFRQIGDWTLMLLRDRERVG